MLNATGVLRSNIATLDHSDNHRPLSYPLVGGLLQVVSFGDACVSRSCSGSHERVGSLTGSSEWQILPVPLLILLRGGN